MRDSSLHIEWSLLTPVIVLVFLGLATLFSINLSFFKSQLIFFILSFGVFIVFSQVNVRVLSHYSLALYIVSLLLLFFVLVLGIESHGAVRWVDILGLRIQFSEVLKPFLIVAFSSYLTQQKVYSVRGFVYSLFLLLPVALLLFFQPDLGNALIYSFVALSTLIVFGFPLYLFGLGALSLVVLFPFVWHFLHEYQKQRITAFLHPGHDPLGSSYNAIQAIIAVGSGMVFGKGLGEGTQSVLKFLPERQTDFIFAALSEEFGLVGGLLVIASFCFLLYKVFYLCKNSEDPFLKVFLSCAYLFWLIQLFLNIGMNVGIVPVVGITLPFVSYGGSSLLSNFMLLGLVSSASRSVKDKKVLEIK